MKYRQFGRLDWKVSALGFGAMRLPTWEDGSVNEPLAIEMMRYAIDHGVNYLDTAYPYHNQQSEIVVGKALQAGYRDKVRVATKLNARFLDSADDFDPMLQEQLAKLQTDRIDFYLLHGMRQACWETLRQWGVLDWLRRKRDDGLIRYLGFSFHDSFEVFQEVVDAFDQWDFCQIQYNFMDVENQAGRKGLEYAASKGLGVVVMEPLLGGNLVEPPEEVQQLWNSAPIQRGPVEWALQWLWDQPQVSVVLSGMSAMEQVVENVTHAGRSGVDSLTDEERALVARVRETYQRLCPVPCTRCGYCMPCPNGVNIPNNFRWFNSGMMYNMEAARSRYRRMAEEERASACIQCRQCEELCPQSIFVSEWMPQVDAVLGQDEPYTCPPV